jgi:hypothetical protein
MELKIRITCFLILNVLLLSVAENIRSQQVYLDGSEELLNILRLDQNITQFETVTYGSIDGNPFLYADFAPGRMILETGEVLGLSLRYDIYSRQIHFKNKDKVYEVVNPEKLDMIVIDTISFQYITYLKSPGDKTPEGSSFLILKTDGKCKLFVKKNMRIQDAEVPKAFQEAQPAKFIPLGDTYYLKPDKKSAVRVTNKKDLLNILADKKDELNKFIDSNKLETKDLDDLVKIVTFYNSL